MAHISELVHKRILVAEKEQSFSHKSTVVELKILEVSPSQNWVKVQNTFGQKYWKPVGDIVPIEVLASVLDKPTN